MTKTLSLKQTTTSLALVLTLITGSLGITSIQAQNLTQTSKSQVSKTLLEDIHQELEEQIYLRGLDSKQAQQLREILERILIGYPILPLPGGGQIDVGPLALLWIPAIIVIIVFSIWEEATIPEAQAPTGPAYRPPVFDCRQYDRNLEDAIRRILGDRQPWDLNCQPGSEDPDCQRACSVYRTFAAFIPICPNLVDRLRHYNPYFHCVYEI